MIPGLSLQYGQYATATLYDDIEKIGGWPMEYKYAGFNHSERREVGFTNNPEGNGWWTVVGNKDDYHLSRVSQERLDKYTERVCYEFANSFRHSKIKGIKYDP